MACPDVADRPTRYIYRCDDGVRPLFGNKLINVAASQVCTCRHTYVYIDAHMLFGIVRDPWLPGTANSRATALWENVVPDTSGQLDQALRICQPEMHQSMIPWPLDPLGVCFLPQWAIQQMWGGRVADPHADVSVDTEAHLVPRVEDIVCSGFHDSLCDRLLQICGLFRWGGAVSVVLWIAWQGLCAALLCQEGLLLMFRHDVPVLLHALASVAEGCCCGMGVGGGPSFIVSLYSQGNVSE